MENPQDNPDYNEPQQLRPPSTTMTNFLDELTNQNRTFLQNEVVARPLEKKDTSNLDSNIENSNGSFNIQMPRADAANNSLEFEMNELGIENENSTNNDPLMF